MRNRSYKYICRGGFTILQGVVTQVCTFTAQKERRRPQHDQTNDLGGGGHFNHRDWNPHRPTRPVTAYTLFREHTRDIDTWHFSDILRYHRQIGRKCYTAIHNSWKQIQGHIVVINISKKSMVTQYRNSSPITRVTVTYVLVDMYPVSDHFV